MIHTSRPLQALDAFCSDCPDAEEVGALLERHGFALVMTMGPSLFTQKSIAPLPAQYHYRDAGGTEVIFLAGKDAPEGGGHFPAHASRWWLYPGSSPTTYHAIKQVLAARWPLTWRLSADT